MGVSTRASPWLILPIFVIGLFFSALIPPFQSPDEFDHIKRAYLLSEGRIVLNAPDGRSSGGMIDSGLSDYFLAYTALPFKPDRKLSVDDISSARGIRWTGVKEFSPAPGTGYYFPLIYLPQAVGLALGESLGLTVDTSYHLARLMALASIAALLFAAFSFYNPSPLVIALLIMPMSVFQLSSASLDGISTALAIFAVATFLRLTSEKTNASPQLFYALTLSVILLAASRVHMLPLLALVFVACFYIKSKRFFYVSAIALSLVVAWLIIAIKTTVDTRLVVGASTSSVALFYLRNPLRFVDVLAATFSDDEVVRFYRDSFVGVLGWLDTRFSEKTYASLSLCVALIGILSVSFRSLRNEWVPQVALLSSALASVVMIFFALLITWNPHPARLVGGVQGRYFLVPMLMIAYATSGGLKPYEGVLRKIALVLVVLLGMFTIFSTSRLLLERYYLALEQPKQVPVVMRASAPLDQMNPIMLFMAGRDEKDLHPLKRLGILFGTHVRKNSGSAELRLTASDGRTLTIRFDLADLSDNQYRFFDLDSIPYSSGQISYLTGGGVSTWEAHTRNDNDKNGDDKNSATATCLIFEYANGNKALTKGCPRP